MSSLFMLYFDFGISVMVFDGEGVLVVYMGSGVDYRYSWVAFCCYLLHTASYTIYLSS